MQKAHHSGSFVFRRMSLANCLASPTSIHLSERVQTWSNFALKCSEMNLRRLDLNMRRFHFSQSKCRAVQIQDDSRHQATQVRVSVKTYKQKELESGSLWTFSAPKSSNWKMHENATELGTSQKCRDRTFFTGSYRRVVENSVEASA